MPWFNRVEVVDSSGLINVDQTLMTAGVGMPTSGAALTRTVLVGRDILENNSDAFISGFESTIIGHEALMSSGYGVVRADLNEGSGRAITEEEKTAHGWVDDAWNPLPGSAPRETLGIYTLTGPIGYSHGNSSMFKSFWLDGATSKPTILSIFGIDAFALTSIVSGETPQEQHDSLLAGLELNSVNRDIIFTEGEDISKYAQSYATDGVPFSTQEEQLEAFAEASLGGELGGTWMYTPVSPPGEVYPNFAPASKNTVVGMWAARFNGTGKENTILGWQAGMHNSTGSHNVSIGHNAALQNRSGSENVSIGWGAAQNTALGNSNVTIGWEAGMDVVRSLESVLIGWRAARNQRGIYESVAIGFEAGLTNDRNGASISPNTITGEGGALSQSVIVGWQAGAGTLNSTVESVLVGWKAGFESKAKGSVVIGHELGRERKMLDNSILLGWEQSQSLVPRTTSIGHSFTAGYGSGFQNKADLLGSFLLGNHAAYQIHSVNYSTITGSNALKNVTTGSQISSVDAYGAVAGEATSRVPLEVDTALSNDTQVIEYFYRDLNYKTGDKVFSHVLVGTTLRTRIWKCDIDYTGEVFATQEGLLQIPPLANFSIVTTLTSLSSVGLTIPKPTALGGVLLYITNGSSLNTGILSKYFSIKTNVNGTSRPYASMFNGLGLTHTQQNETPWTQEVLDTILFNDSILGLSRDFHVIPQDTTIFCDLKGSDTFQPRVSVTNVGNDRVLYIADEVMTLPVYTNENRDTHVTYTVYTTPPEANLSAPKVLVSRGLCLGAQTSFGNVEDNGEGLYITSNETVIGPYALGNGANTTTLNNQFCKTTVIEGTDTSRLVISGDTLNIANTKTPASAGAAGTKGDIVWSGDHLYICTATNTWKRAALSTF